MKASLERGLGLPVPFAEPPEPGLVCRTLRSVRVMAGHCGVSQGLVRKL
jgi:hypothetical protein